MAFVSSSLSELLTLCRERVQIELASIVSGSPSDLYGILKYHMGWQDEHNNPCHSKLGKFIRPTLCVLSCQVVKGDALQIVPAAAAVELVHGFSLIHDDIEDASDERRQRPTVWRLWGQPQAINAGDTMFALAYLAVLRLKNNGIADEKIMRSVCILGESCLRLCEGQYLDIAYENRLDVSTDCYLDMISKKTATLMAASTYIGAYLGTEDLKLVESLYRFGTELGMAYQIRDDILGIWGVEGRTGKSNSDISQRKKTLPVVYGLQNSTQKDRRILEEMYIGSHIQDEQVAEVIRILERVGAREYAQELAWQYYRRALTHIETSGLDITGQNAIREATGFLIERDY